jgi:hypothetical protein
MSDERYSIGDLENPQPDDTRFDTREEAERAAIQCSYNDMPWGVWFDEDGELLSIVYGQTVYSS